MTPKLLAQYSRKFNWWVRKQNKPTLIFAYLLVLIVLLYAYQMNTRRLSVDPTTYAPLIQLIGTAESNNNYNAHFGNASNSQIDFTNMTIDEVMKWQTDFVAGGSPSSAVGRYQILSTTLKSLVKELDIDTKQKFDPRMQDKLAIALFERRGSIDYVNKQLSKEAFAANLAKEWAALPKVVGSNPTSSYYDGDGLNKSRTTIDEVLTTIHAIRPQK